MDSMSLHQTPQHPRSYRNTEGCNKHSLISRDCSLSITLRTQYHGVDKYPAKSHARRAAEELRIDKGTIVLAASPSELYPDSDQDVPFRQDRYFYYLTGCNEPGCFVSYDMERDYLTLWLPSIDESRVVWTGRGSTIDEALERYDIDDAQYLDDDGSLSSMLIAFHKLGRSEELFVLENHWQRVFRQSAYRHRTGSQGRKLQHALTACRVIKDEYEIELIRKANEITAAAHKAVMRGLHKMKNEADVDAAYTAVCISKHAKEQAYSPIAGAGPNASELHYGKNKGDFGDGQTLVLDAGCEVHCYASDVTRTVPLNTQRPGFWPSSEAENIYKLVERVQEACIAQMKPGNNFIEIVSLARRTLMDGLLALGILKGNPDDIWNAGTVFGFFPHGLGHHLGLEVHDVSPIPAPPAADAANTFTSLWAGESAAPCSAMPDVETVPADLVCLLPKAFSFLDSNLYSTNASESKLDPDMVITIEPGCYFNSFLLERFFLSNPAQSKFIDKDVLDRYMKVGGVRIEDDIRITKDGYENLTTAPKGKSMLKMIQRGAHKASSRQ